MSKYIAPKAVKVPKWQAIDTQTISDGDVVYSIPSIITQARNLKPFSIPIAGIWLGYGISSEDISDFVEHMKAVLAVDKSYPIILDHQGWVIDGRHRIARALYDGDIYIQAVRFQEPPEYMRKEEDKS